MLLRTLFYCLPAVLIGITLWAVDQVKASRALRHGDLVALMSEPQTPALNPYQPTTEAERQLTELIHEPLIRIGADGRLAPALAREWRWLKRATAWFVDPSGAATAQQQLDNVRDQWAGWQLAEARADGRVLQLTFTDPLMGAVRDTLQAARARVQAVMILRIEVPHLASKAHLAIIAHSTLSSHVQRWWLDGDDALEIAVTGVEADYLTELQRHLEHSLPEAARISVRAVASLPVLEEPVLEFTLREARWHNGGAVTATDVRATWETVSKRAWTLPNAEGLRVVRAVEASAPDRVQVVLWRRYGPALCAWIDLPILPAEWLKKHPLDDAGRVFRDSMPPGAGPCRVEHRDHGSLVVRPTEVNASTVRRLTLITSLSGFSTQLGYSTRALDLFWPHAEALALTPGDEPLVPRPSPPREIVQVVFNTRREPLKDVAIRQALTLATDRRALIVPAERAVAMPHASVFAPKLWLSAQPSVPAANRSGAEEMLVNAGWLKNASGIAANPSGALVFRLLTCSDDSRLLGLAANLRLQWLRLGVQIVLQTLPRATVLNQMEEGNFDAVLISQIPPLTWDLTAVWHSESPSNVTGFGSRPADLLIEALAQEFDPDEAAKRSQRLETLILADSPVIPLLTFHENAMLRASLTTALDPVPWTLRSLLGVP